MNRAGFVIRILIMLCTIGFSVPSDGCVLDMSTPPSWNANQGNWGGFLRSNSCALPFQTYLFALAKKANGTGEIFLNVTQQNACDEGGSLRCGIERLTSGSGGCSDYTVADVAAEQGGALRSLDEGCSDLGSGDECRGCLGRWDRMGGSASSGDGFAAEEVVVCRFSVLVSLASRRIDDVGWMNLLFTCLGDGVPLDDQGGEGKKMVYITRGLEVLVGGVGGISIVVAIVCRIFIKKRPKIKPPKGFDVRDNSISEEASSAKISLKEVHIATDNLSPSNFIGQGIAGKVYKGVLSNGQRVAVKHIINDGHMDTFVREVTSLSHVKHPNLVELLGHCDGEDESFLVYELCDLGNLSEWLFGKQRSLTWMQRLEIAIDCARGLRFLHTYAEGCIIHRDIKPTNILLGSNFKAKLSDFGLSKVLCMGVSHVSSEVRGTFGYVDPEYQKDRHVHSSTDVYSFGVVLLQIISGQRVINLEVNKPMPLSKMAKNLRKGGDITEFADPKLEGEYSGEAFGLVFKLALSCTGLKQQRPSMERVVAVLEKAHLVSASQKSVDSSLHSM